MQPADSLQQRQPLPDLIRSSWMRCRSAGLSANWHVQQTPLSDADLHQQQERNRQMRRLALREMNILQRSLEDSGRILLLSDATGTILDSQGDLNFLGRVRRVFLTPGASWKEQMTGTNAIGTAIVERRFVQVLGTQHFFEENRFLACNAMPITSPTGELAGVLDISGNACEPIGSAARLVRHAAAHIERDWVAESATELIVRLHQHPAWLGTPDEGILHFEDGLLTMASPRGLAFLGLQPAAIGCVRWQDLFEGEPSYGRQELHLQHRAGLLYADISRAFSAAARIATSAPVHHGPDTFEDLKDDALRRAIEVENGNIAAAARRLRVHRSTFYRRLKRSQDSTAQ